MRHGRAYLWRRAGRDGMQSAGDSGARIQRRGHAGGKRRHPTDVDRSSGDPAYPVRLPCAADHRGAAVRDRERNGDAGRTGPGAVAAGISGKAGGRAVGTAAEPE